jgi:hypothetical protein
MHRTRRRFTAEFKTETVELLEESGQTLQLIDPDALERRFLGRAGAVLRPVEGAPRRVAINGETVRRSVGRQNGRPPLLSVSAYATEHGLALV